MFQVNYGSNLWERISDRMAMFILKDTYGDKADILAKNLTENLKKELPIREGLIRYFQETT